MTSLGLVSFIAVRLDSFSYSLIGFNSRPSLRIVFYQNASETCERCVGVSKPR